MNKKNTIDNNLKFFTVKSFAKKNEAEGMWPSSESSVWDLRANAAQNGFSNAFITVGRRVLIDEKKFWEAINNSKGGIHE